jgi:ribonuclease HI
MFNFSICDELGLEIEDKLDGGLSTAEKFSAYHCFTDGSFIRGQGAGWSLAVFDRGDSAGEGKPFLTAAGPIVTLRKSNLFVGAERLTSGVAEINAVIESLLWWASVGEAKRTGNNQHQHPIKIGEAIIFTLDSQYVVKLLQGKCRAIENKLLINFMVHLWKFVGSFFPSESTGAQATTTQQRIFTTPRHRCCG